MKPSRSDPKRVRSAETEGQLLRAILEGPLHQVVVYGKALAAGSDDAHDVHQLRVGIRRIRTALRAFGGVTPSLADCERPLATVFRALGEWRDARITRDIFEPKLRAAGAPRVALMRSAGTDRCPNELVLSHNFRSAVVRLLRFADANSADEAGASDAHTTGLKSLLDQKLNKLHMQVLHDGGRFGQLKQSEQHRVRKRLKRLRYLSEFVAPRYKYGAVKRYLKALTPAQDAFGAHNDLVVALAAYDKLAKTNPMALFAVGWLTARLEHTAKQSHRALGALDRTSRFWR